jgi:lipoprotein-releasing system permease protein
MTSLPRHLKILEYALSSLWRRKGKNLAILVVFVFTVAALTSILFLTHALKIEAAHLLRGAPELVVQRISAGRHALVPASYERDVEAMPGVGRVTPRYWGYYYDALTGANYTVLGVGGESPEVRFLDGRLPASPGECALGAGVAGVRHVEVGEDLILIDGRNVGVTFEVVGVFEAPSNLLTNDLVLMTDEDVADFFALPPGMATDLLIQVHNPAEVSTVAGKIKRALPDTRPITRSEMIRTYDAVFDWRGGMILAAFAGSLVAFCILAWDKATGISAEERQEIGVLKAVGWDTSDVLELKCWEGLALSLTALLLGVALAYVHVFLLGAPILEPVLKGWSVLFPDFRPVPFVDLYQVFVVAFLTVAPYVASTVIPSWKAASTDPETVMRG